MMLQYLDDFQAVLFLGLLKLLNNNQVPSYDLLIHYIQNLHHYMMLQYLDDFQAVLFPGLLKLLSNN